MRVAFELAMRGLFTIYLSIGGGLAAGQTFTPAELEPLLTRELSIVVNDAAALDTAIDQVYGQAIEPAKREVARTMLRAIMGHARMPRYLAQVAAPLVGPEMPKDVRPYVMGSMGALYIRGMRRMPTERQARYVRNITLGTVATYPPNFCKAAFLGRLDARTALAFEPRYYASLSLGEFEAVLSLQQAAVEAELSGYPSIRTVNAVQTDGAVRAYQQAMRRRIDQLPPGLDDRVMRDPESADASDVCKWFLAASAAIFDLQEPYLGWYLAQMINEMQ